MLVVEVFKDVSGGRYVDESIGWDGWLTLQIRFAFYLSRSFSQSSALFVQRSIDNGNKRVSEEVLGLNNIPIHLISAELYE